MLLWQGHLLTHCMVAWKEFWFGLAQLVVFATDGYRWGQCMLSFNRWVGVSIFARFRMKYIHFLIVDIPDISGKTTKVALQNHLEERNILPQFSELRWTWKDQLVKLHQKLINLPIVTRGRGLAIGIGWTEIIPFIVGVKRRHEKPPSIHQWLIFFFFRIIQISFTKGIWILVSISIEFQLLPAPQIIPNHWHQYSKTDLHVTFGTSTFVSKKNNKKQPFPLL